MLQIKEICVKRFRSSDEDTKIVKILAPLTDNPNAPDEDEITPSSVAKNEEIVRILNSATSRKCNSSMLSGNPSTK